MLRHSFSLVLLIPVITVLSAGLLMGWHRLCKPLWGYAHDRLLGVYRQGETFVRDSGYLPLSIVRIGTFLLFCGLVAQWNSDVLNLTSNAAYWGIVGAFGLIQLFVAAPLAAILPVRRIGGIGGGLIGALTGAMATPALVLWGSKLLFPEFSEDAGIGILSAMAGMFAGIIIGGKLADGEFGGAHIPKTLESCLQEIGAWFLIYSVAGGFLSAMLMMSHGQGSDAFTGGLVGWLGGAFVGALYGNCVVLLLILARAFSWGMEVLLRTPLTLSRFATIVCQECLRLTFPLQSRYEKGERFCEHCDQPVELTKIPGKVIVTFGTITPPSGKRFFVLPDPDFEEKERIIDISDLYLDPATTDRRLLERFITYIINHPPKEGVDSIRVFFGGGLEALGTNLKNVLHNTFDTLEQVQ